MRGTPGTRSFLILLAGLFFAHPYFTEVLAAPYRLKLVYKSERPGIDSQLVFGERHAFVSVEGGVLRLPLRISRRSGATLLPFDSRVRMLHAVGATLYVSLARDGPDDSGDLFWRSGDHGETFQAIGEALRIDDDYYLSPAAMQFHNDIMYVTAGGSRNVFASTDDGESYSVVSGILDGTVCSPPAFLVRQSSLLIGGECPLDTAFIVHGELDSTGTNHIPDDEFQSPALPDLKNRNIQIIEEIDGSLFAGAEGAILRSQDGGESFQFVYRILQDTEKRRTYPYVRSFAAHPMKSGLLLASGFDKARGIGWAGYSENAGQWWKPLSPRLFRRLGVEKFFDNASVETVIQDPYGRILFLYSSSSTTRIYRLQKVRRKRLQSR